MRGLRWCGLFAALVWMSGCFDGYIGTSAAPPDSSDVSDLDAGGEVGQEDATGQDAMEDPAVRDDATNDVAEDACEPTTCEALLAECGTIPDGCGERRACGDCPDGERCGGGGPNRCGQQSCEPTSCEALGVQCGLAPDGCEDVLDCGGCEGDDRCQDGRCVCIPRRCADVAGACGALDDGCGRTVDCGPCDTDEACPLHPTRCDGRACGDDGFGGSCGECPQGRSCSLDGQCEACVPSCTVRIDFRNAWREVQKVCGDDGCGGSCGQCSDGLECYEGECMPGHSQPDLEARAMFFVNEVRTTTEPRPRSCTYEGDNPYCEDRTYLPSRLNADMIRTSRLFAHHVIKWRLQTGQGFCGHDDPLDMIGAVGDRFGAFLGEQGVQNAWCSPISPEGAPILGDPYHCCAMLVADATDWGLGQAEDLTSGGGGYQSQDIGTDPAFLPMVIDNEAVETASRTVSVSVWPAGVVRLVRSMTEVVEVQLSEDPCFRQASWLPWAPTIPFELSAGQGRKVVYARARDASGLTAVTWDSIWLGAAPSSLDSMQEAITRIRSVRLPPLGREGFSELVLGTGLHVEAEAMGRWNFGPSDDVEDADASGGRARRTKLPGQAGDESVVYTGARTGVPLGQGEIWARIKVEDNAVGATVANVRWREDSGGMVGGRAIPSEAFTQAGRYQWFRVPYTRLFENSLFYIELSSGDGVLFDRLELFSAPRPVADTQVAGGLTLDFAGRNWRGVELVVRYVNPDSDVFEEGERINPYCALCSR